MLDKLRELINKVFGSKELLVKQDWMRLEADDIACCTVPLLVHYKYHRYFWRATSGKYVKHVETYITLN